MRGADVIAKFLRISRRREWWEFKLAPVFGTVYATSLVAGVPLAETFPMLLFLLAALVPGAVFVSLINDLTDLEDDARAGKENRLRDEPKRFVYPAIVVCLLCGSAVGFFLAELSLLFYLLAWIAYALYSIPPVRLKKRGFSGVLADAFGANVLPQLFAAALVFEWFGRNPDAVWLTAVGLWSLGWGVRGIVWHQMKDKTNDRRSATETFVRRQRPSFIRKLIKGFVFPLELTAFVFMNIRLGSLFPPVFAGFYLLVEYVRYAVFDLYIILFEPRPHSRIFLEEHYSLFYPLACLAAGIVADPSAVWILLLHLLVFPGKFLAVLLLEVPHIPAAVRDFIRGY